MEEAGESSWKRSFGGRRRVGCVGRFPPRLGQGMPASEVPERRASVCVAVDVEPFVRRIGRFTLRLVGMTSGSGSKSTVTRVCRRCSVQSQTQGDFCPNCGRSFSRRAISQRARVAIVAAVVLVLLGGAGAALAVKVNNDRAEEAANEAAEAKAAAKSEREAEEEAAAKRAADTKRAAQEGERDQRADLIKQMQKSITKDARSDVGNGLLDGPIFYTSCDPLGGGSIDDLTELTTTFECIAVNEKRKDGTARGYVYSATMNWDEYSWGWRLGA